MTDATFAAFPKRITLSDGRIAELRPMLRTDRDRVLEFARALPEEDLLFLRVDLTQAEVVDQWVRDLEAGVASSLLALLPDGSLGGYATVHRNPARWTRRVGEIRVNVARAARGVGLGRNLTAQIVDIARSLGLRKLSAQMTTDEAGARNAFKRLGFVPEAVLADFVEDRNGTPRDLLLMTYDLAGLSDRVEEPLRL
jgi:RimJ/RimL family protein N-acetyltransferase